MDIKFYILQAILSVATLVAGYCVLYNNHHIKKKLSEVKDFIPLDGVLIDGLFDNAAVVITKMAESTVGKLEQVFGQDLRERIKAGEAGKAELLILADEAYKEIVATVKPEIISCLKESIDDVELYIRNIIETELLKLKADLSK